VSFGLGIPGEKFSLGDGPVEKRCKVEIEELAMPAASFLISSFAPASPVSCDRSKAEDPSRESRGEFDR